MDISNWLQIVFICTLGAVSPGPSLAAVISNTISYGRIYGVMTGIGHGIGITLWASVTAIGVAGTLVYSSNILIGVQFLGACLIGYIGIRSLGSSAGINTNYLTHTNPRNLQGLIEGFMIALLNPKIALFFIAIFSQFIIEDSHWIKVSLMGITAGAIDALWYTIVAVIISRATVLKLMEGKSIIIAKVSGILLILVSLYLVTTIISNATEKLF